MKKLITLAIAAFTLVGSTYAQQATMQKHHKKNHGAQHMKKHKGKMAHSLKLNAEQKKQAQVIQKNFQEKLTKLKSNDKITLGDYKKQLASLEKERKTNMQALLTNEQKNKIAVGKKNAEDNRQIRSVAMLERMKLKLNLNEEQVSKIKTMQQSLQQKAKAIQNNDALSSMDKKDQMHQLGAERKKVFEQVLTKEQQEQIKQRKGEKRQAK